MRERGIDLAHAKPQKLTDELARGRNGSSRWAAATSAPSSLARKRDDWPLEDPKGKPRERVREIRDDIEARVRSLIAANGWAARTIVRSAVASDVQTVEALLLRAALPPDGIADQFPDAYSIAEADGRIVGAAGIERYGDAGLLRSVVVADEYRGRGIAEALVRERLTIARAAGIKRVFALTTTAASYFPRLGFVAADRAAAPEPLRRSPQLASVCPSSAAFLEYRL